ncbi:hypothetical protein V5799_016879 [Amblyomma americanum]|uniref:Uncharacterized protein n=1 Tax=Amblyomma americanum TaxID=6943 RepID=A0AAQ4F515_AMBAM
MVAAASAMKFDFTALDPKIILDKIRDTMEMLMSMLWVTGASPQCAKTLKQLIRDTFGGKVWALYALPSRRDRERR